MRILYLGENEGTSKQRADALRRLGHSVQLIETYSFVPTGRFTSVWIWRTGALGLESRITRGVLRSILPGEFDLVWVNHGELVGPALVRELKRRYGCVVNYNAEDPFGTRDGALWRVFLQSVPYYDLLVVVREPNVREAKSRGARDVMLVYRSADEVAHAPRELTPEQQQQWGNEVVFVGTWMPERGPFMAQLVQRGVPLAIYGDRWQKAKEWPLLRQHWRGPGVFDPEQYACAVLGAKICLGLVSIGNRDLHTTRSAEIPYLGGLFCAERTKDHQELYREDEDAVFWNDPEACARKCLALLHDDERRRRIARSGHARCVLNGTLNERVMDAVLQRALAGLSASVVVG